MIEKNFSDLDNSEETIASDIYEERAKIIRKDKNHPEANNKYEMAGEENTDLSNHRDVEDTGDHGIGGGEVKLDNSNVEETKEEVQDEDKGDEMKII